MRILVADPDESFKGILKSFLYHRGHAPEFASNDLECINILHNYTTEMLVLAGDLSGGSVGVLTELSRDEKLSQLPVVLVSETFQHEVPRWQRSPLGSLRRPFSLTELDRKIEMAKVLASLQEDAASHSMIESGD